MNARDVLRLAGWLLLFIAVCSAGDVALILADQHWHWHLF
jgi:hypothetical protein